jgi:hypothetical protein
MPANLVFCCGAAEGGRRKRFELISTSTAALVVQIMAEFCVNWPFSVGAGFKASVSLVLSQYTGPWVLSERKE